MLNHIHRDFPDNFGSQMDKQVGMFNFIFKGFFIFWIISALAGLGLTVAVIVLIVKLIQHFSV